MSQLVEPGPRGVLHERPPIAEGDGTVPPPRRRLWKVALPLAAVLALVIVVVLVMRGRSAPAAPPVSDVPRSVGGAIEVSEAFRAAAGIETTPVVRAPLAPTVTVLGAATFDPTQVAAVGTRAPGIVRKVYFVEGATVRAGDLLAEIESPNLADSQADVRIAAAKKEAASLNFERERDLFARRLTTAREHEQAAAALEEQKALAAAARQRVEALGGSHRPGISELRAPVAGVVAERSIAPGQSVGPGLVAFRVGDLDQLWVVLRVFERHLEVVRVGDDVDIRQVSTPEHVIHGKVAHVGAVIDPTTRSGDVRVEVDNGERILRPGQGVKATIRASGPARVGLSVPSEAVTLVDGKPTIFVAQTPTRFEPRTVELGIDAGEQVEIRQGVREGEAVVSRSVLALKSELFR